MSPGQPGVANSSPVAPAAPVAMERAISRILWGGVLLSTVLLVLGLGLLLVRDASNPDTGPFRLSVPGLLAGLLALDPYAVIALGLFVLILTPFTRVLISIGSFVQERDSAFVAMTLFVLVVLVASVALGVVP
jgi:uncharacterized membrane protein